MKLDVLAIAAHPDDVELACGGTVVKCLKQGKRVGLLDLTGGELSTRGNPELRAKEAAEAARILGVTTRLNLGLEDGNITDTRENILRLVTVLRKYQPDTLLFPHFQERHPDHEHAHRLCREAWFYSGLTNITTHEAGKSQTAFRPRSYFLYMQTYEFVPSFIVDISDEYEQRMEAVHAYRSQFHDPASNDPETFLSSPEFMVMLRSRMEHFGHMIGKKYGEPFQMLTPVGVSDLSHVF